MDINENHILVGLGGTGGKVLKAFRKRLFQEHTADQRAKLPLGYVYVDSSKEMMQPNDITFRVLGQDASFNESEFVFIKGINLQSVFSNPSGFPGLKGFIGDPEVMQKTIGSVEAAAAQKRRAGRILFGSSVQAYLNTLKGQYTKVKSISSTTKLNIHIFTGLAGGTGSGSIIDVLAQTRNEYRDANIILYAMIPEHTPPGTCDAGRYHANGYAALTEMNAMMVKKYMPYDVTGHSERVPLENASRVVNSGPGIFVLPVLCMIGGIILLTKPSDSRDVLVLLSGIVVLVYGVSEFVATWKMNRAMKAFESESREGDSAKEEMSGAKDVDYEKVK